MSKSYLLSSRELTQLVINKTHLIGDIGLTKWDLLSMVVEYFEYYTRYGGNIKTYLDEMWLLKESVIPIIVVFIEAIVEDIKIFCPELIDVLENNKNLYLAQYNEHTFVLEKREAVC